MKKVLTVILVVFGVMALLVPVSERWAVPQGSDLKLCSSYEAKRAAPPPPDAPRADRWSYQVNETIRPVTVGVSNIIFAEIKLPPALSAPTESTVDAVGYDQPVSCLTHTEVPLILLWLLTGAIIFTLYMGFVNLWGVRQSLKIVRGDYDNPDDSGEVTHFQALTAALSGTVGLGNIAGVAIAISWGGPGAAFWMILAGFFGMTSKFVECTLGVKYRRINEEGVVAGGPIYYLTRSFAERKKPMLGTILAGFFAICCIGGTFGAGNMFQTSQAYTQFSNVMGSLLGGSFSWFYDTGWFFGLTVAFLAGLVIIGGIRGIARVTDKLVPFMCTVYLLGGLFILGANFDQIPHAFMMIFEGAFSAEGVQGGFIGVLLVGLRRAAFSNEAGIGSAPIAHSAVKTEEPITEGLVALLEPFVDTIIVCTMTALVIIITNSYQTEVTEGIAMTSEAFSSVLPWFDKVLAVAVILFAFSTTLTWSYYGLKCWHFLFGDGRVPDISYKVLFCLIIVAGTQMTLDDVIGFSDGMLFAMAIPNMIAMYMLAPEVKADLHSYFARIKSGEIVDRREREKRAAQAAEADAGGA